MNRATADKLGQYRFPGTGRPRRRRERGAPLDTPPCLAALLNDRDRFEAEGGRLAWQREQVRRRTDLVARVRARRRAGYWTTGRIAA